jgi:hypothetical protein
MWARRLRVKGFGLLGPCFGTLACSGAADIPPTPDLTKLQGLYDRPTAMLDATSAVEALRQMPSLPDLVAGFRASGYAVKGVDEASSLPPVEGFRVQGGLDVTVQCPGDLAVAAYGTNGSISFTLGVEKNLIKRGISGQATKCVLHGERVGVPIRVELNGPVAFDLGRDLGLHQRWSGRLLMNVGGSLDVAGYTLDNLSARWTDDRVEYLHVLEDGDTVVAVVTDEGAVALRDQQTIWGCQGNESCAAQ